MNPTQRRQIIERFARAFRVSQFDVRIIKQDGAVRAVRQFTVEQFIDAHDWFAACSSERDHVFFRPAGLLRWVLVDDLTATGLQWLRDDGVLPSVIVETNPHTPDNLQAWVCIGRDVPDEVASCAARILAARYGGDTGAASHSQLGRIVGAYNAKPHHWRQDAMPPLVKLRFADDKSVHFALDVRDEAREMAEKERREQEPPASASLATGAMILPMINTDDGLLLADLFDDAMTRFRDRSRADISVARTMHDSGNTPDQIAAALFTHSGKAHEREQRKTGDGWRYVTDIVRKITSSTTATTAEKETKR